MAQMLHLTLNDIQALRVGCGNDACRASLSVPLERERPFPDKCPGCGQFWSTYNNQPELIQKVAEILKHAKTGDPLGIGFEVACKEGQDTPRRGQER